MIRILESKREEIEDACVKYAVARLEVFGSAVSGKFDPDRSDVDFLVEFGVAGTLNALDQYLGLKQTLESILNRPVDLVMEGALRNPFFIDAINRTRKLIYAAQDTEAA